MTQVNYATIEHVARALRDAYITLHLHDDEVDEDLATPRDFLECCIRMRCRLLPCTLSQQDLTTFRGLPSSRLKVLRELWSYWDECCLFDC